MTFRKAASGATHLGRGAAMASKQHTRGACKTGPTTGQRRAWEEMRVLSEAGVMFSASRPCNPGVTVCRKLARICPMPAPVGEVSDITRQYVAKYGEIQIGRAHV